MGAKIRKYPEKSKIRVNICKKNAKSFAVNKNVSIFVAE